MAHVGARPLADLAEATRLARAFGDALGQPAGVDVTEIIVQPTRQR
ncbi:hypothetical protein ABH935_001550 [Catenulispora sp. GAS73]